MKNVACLIDTISRNAGGLNSSVKGVMNNLMTRGDMVHVFSTWDNYSKEDLTGWSQFNVHLSPSLGPRKFGYGPRFNRELAMHNFDILHTHGLWNYTSVVATKWRLKNRKPVIIHPHGMLDPWALKNSRWKKWLAMALYEGRNLKGASCIRALCLSELESVRALGLKNPICVIPNGIELPTLNQNDAGAIKPGKKLLLFLGRLHPKKGISMLIEALAQANQSQTLADWSLVIAGWDQGAHETELKSQATKLGIQWSDLRDLSNSDNFLQLGLENPPPIVFTGPAFGADKERLYRACSAFVLPSFSEGLPMVVLEAWSYGKPVMITSMCNLPEGFDADAAMKIEATVESVQEGFKKLVHMSLPELEAMGVRGRNLVQKRFSWSQIGEDMKLVSRWLVDREKAPSCVDLAV